MGGIAQQVMQPFQGILVAPMDILNHQQERFFLLQYRPGQGFKHALALPGFGNRAGRLQVRMRLQQFRQQARKLAQPDRFQAC